MNQNKYDNPRQPVEPSLYAYSKHKRGATSSQQAEYLTAAREKRARKNAKRAKEAQRS